jgi:4-hydroxybutyryl-CoA dehydratase/vinylacetyl-CoA-Delta-isomerase
MLTGQQYRQSLHDDRRVFFAGEEVDVTSHEIFDRAIDLVAGNYDRFYDPAPDAISEYFRAPNSIEELRAHSEIMVDTLTATTYGSHMTLLTSADRIEHIRPESSEAIREYVREVRARDLRVAECITDAKGDRSKAPGAQPDPDAYLRVVDRQSDGVVIRGAKLHISGAPLAHELLVIPTKSMKAGEEAYAVACTVPVDAPGVKIVNVTSQPIGEENLRDAPLSSDAHTPVGFVIFDDVFVPNERVFLDGETAAAAIFAHSLGLWVRLNGLKSMADEADLLVGFAQLLAEANGLERADGIRHKITDMVVHATLVRATLEAALSNSEISSEGVVVPNELYANAGKYQGAAHRAQMIQHLQDIAGGSLTTAPSTLDLAHPEIGAEIRKYMAGGPDIDGAYRARLFHAVRDLTSSVHAGHKTVGILQGGGGLFAQRIVTRARYDITAARARALDAAGLDDPKG